MENKLKEIKQLDLLLAHTTGNIVAAHAPTTSIFSPLSQTTLGKPSPDLTFILASCQSLIRVQDCISGLNKVRIAGLSCLSSVIPSLFGGDVLTKP